MKEESIWPQSVYLVAKLQLWFPEFMGFYFCADSEVWKGSVVIVFCMIPLF